MYLLKLQYKLNKVYYDIDYYNSRRDRLDELYKLIREYIEYYIYGLSMEAGGKACISYALWEVNSKKEEEILKVLGMESDVDIIRIYEVEKLKQKRVSLIKGRVKKRLKELLVKDIIE